MYTLKSENRVLGLKSKQLRKKGVIPGVLYGKNLDESLNLQFTQGDIVRFLKSNSTGSRVELVIGEEKYLSLLREITCKPSTGEIEHLSFQTLLVGEVIASTARISLLNREKVSGIILQPQSEISYKALPAHLTDLIEIDLEGMSEGDSIRISDLDFAKNPDIEILNPLDTMVVSITESRKIVETTETTEEEGEEATETEEETTEA